MIRADVQHIGKEVCCLSSESVISVMRLISEDSGFNVSNRFIIIFMLNFYAGSDKEDGLMSALFFVAPARQSEAFSRREASPLGRYWHHNDIHSKRAPPVQHVRFHNPRGSRHSCSQGPAGPISLKTVHWTVFRALEPPLTDFT